ncbi:MAG: hypothetical protein ACRDQ5_25055 [Sciscionella sp.]
MTEIDKIDKRLHELMTRGYQFLHPRSANGAVVSVLGFLAHHGVIDLVQIYAEDDAVALRMSGDEQDMLAPREVLWRSGGAAGEVIGAILDLPDPASALPEQREGVTGGLWVPVRPGQAKWVAARA